MPADTEVIAATVADRPTWQFSRVSRATARVLDAALAPHGIGRLHAVVCLAVADGPLTQAGLRHALKVDGSDLVAVLDRLQEIGWVTRTPDPEDRRRNTIKLTGLGRRKAKSVESALAKAEASLLDALSDRERTQLTKLLAKVAD